VIKNTVAFSLLCCSLAANSQNTANPDLENALLWKISGNELTAPSYLYGTIHLICEEDFIEVDGLQTAFDNTEQLVIESDVTDIMSAFKVLIKGKMKDGITLQDLITEEEYAEVKTYFKTNVGMPLSMVHGLQPILLSSFLALGGGENSCAQKSYEMEFIERSKKSKEAVKFLETAEEIIGVLDKIPYGQQAKIFMQSMGEGGKEEVNALTKMYVTQDINALDKYMHSNDDEMAEFGAFLIDERNNNWMDNIHGYITNKPTLIAVGAGHLPGDKGLIALLRKEGYTVNAVLPESSSN